MSIHTERLNPDFQGHEFDSLKCDCKRYNSDSRSRRLVVAFDGTQNQFGPQSSHVVEFYSRIVKSADQLSYYTSGVGTFVKPTSNMKHMRMWVKNKWAAAVARHFKSNLLSGYRFLSEKYEKGDQIFLLGFSRGAYQARVLAAMITKVGLLRTGNNEQIPFAFSMYMDPEASKEIPIDSDYPYGEKTTAANEFKKTFCNGVNIHFVGVWDTVSSVGAFRNKSYPGAELAENICFFRHALALDERRVKFIPEYIFAKKEFFYPGEFGRPRCKEVWFRGSHSDVGGGNVKNSTSDNGAIPSRWMAYEAMLAGLEMTPFRGGITVKDLEPKIGKESMSRLYTFLEYVFFIKWEVHSESRPPLLKNPPPLPFRTSEQPRAAEDFSRAWHRKRPRQIYDHHKLHSSVCLHKKSDHSDDSSKNPSPFARLPTSWTNDSDWTKIINLLRDQGENAKVAAVGAFDSSNKIVLFGPPRLHAEPKIEPGTLAEPPSKFTVSGTVRTMRDVVAGMTGPSVTFSSMNMQAVRNIADAKAVRDITDTKAARDIADTNLDVLLPEAFARTIELDLLDCDAIPALITGVLRGTNVKEFLERLGVLACTRRGSVNIRDHIQFSSMLQQVYSDERYTEYTGSAIRVAYQVFWHSEVDLYVHNEKLWKAILSLVERWNRSQTDSTASSSLHRAGRLLHKTKTDQASVEIKHAIIRIFNQWERSFTEHPSAPIQLYLLLTTAMEYDLHDQDSILRLAVLSSSHISDEVFSETLIRRLLITILNADGETRKWAMLCLCVFRAFDDTLIFDEELSSLLNGVLVKLGTPIQEIWALVTQDEFPMSTGFDWRQKIIPKLKNLLLDPATESLGKDYRSWAYYALDKALDPQGTKLTLSPEGRINYGEPDL